MGSYTLGLADAGQDDLPLVGGKAAGLGELVKAGFSVPAGFVVTTDAYRAFIAAAGLDGMDPTRLGERIAGAPLPDDLAAPIVDAYLRLAAPAVAVRSSGTAEDLADASFAGQHDTFLNVSGERAVLGAVRGCWASLWTPRAVDYRRQRGFDDQELALAVVVQTMVDAEWAGVMFTADPVSGRRGRMVVEAVRGLADALVSGEVGGHRHVVDKARGRLLTGDTPLPRPLLDDLVSLGGRVEAAFGRPQDIEWAYAEGRCSLVQARPLTALPGEPHDAATRDGRLRGRVAKVAAHQAAEHLPYPPFPLDVSLFYRPAIGAAVNGLCGLGLTTPDADHVLVEIGDGVVQITPPRVRPTPQAAVRLASRLPRLVAALRSRPDEWLHRSENTLVAMVHEIDGEDLSHLTDQELVDRVDRLRRTLAAFVPSRFACVPRGMLADRRLAGSLRLAAGRSSPTLYADLLSDVPCVTTEANQGLARLAAAVAASPELARVYQEEKPDDVPDRLRSSAAGQALLDDVDAYLRRYGYREPSMPTVGLPPLRDAPHIVHALIKGLAEAMAGTPGSEDGTREARARRTLTSGGGPRQRIFGALALRSLGAARDFVAFREDSHYHLFMPFAAIRRVVLELGRRLADRGVLDRPEDVFYLESDEIRDPQAERTPEVVRARKAARASALDHYTVLPVDIVGDATGGDALRGAPASAGRVVGRVRVVRDERDFGALRRGEVLVCPYTNPGWTPLFALASAVVVDAGGAVSHAAIVAREYGIPAVMGTGGATRVLRDGQRVLVDGSAGTVVLVGAEGAA